MHNEQRKAGLIFRAVVAGAMAAALAGPAGADEDDQEEPQVSPRTGELHRDCEQFASEVRDDKFVFKMWCRKNDETYDLFPAETDLAAKIGYNYFEGVLEWGGSLFHQECESNQTGVLISYDGIWLDALCPYKECLPSESGDSDSDEDCRVVMRRTPQLPLHDHYEVRNWEIVPK